MGMINRHNAGWFVLLITLVLRGAAGAEPNDANNLASRILNELPATVISDANYTFTQPDNIVPLLLAGGASIAMHNSDADRNINDNLDRHRGFNDTTDKIFDYAGSPWTHLGATGLWYFYSEANRDDLNRERAWATLNALALTDTLTFGLKAIRNNERPNGKDMSWPSGHAASSFCMASVLDEFYGPKVGIPAYIGACFVGWRMMDSGEHWASDVLFGGTLGFVIGHSVAARHTQLEIAGFQVQPMTTWDFNPVMGVCLVKRF